MESMSQELSKWFYLGLAAIIVGVILIYRARGQNKSKTMENGYFILILGLVGVISEWTDFATVLFIFVILTGGILALDKLVWIKKGRDSRITTPHYVHYAREFFPVVLGVFILRAFLFEAYQIPSSSMRPDLTVGDFILVNKFTYGIREPITNQVLIPIHKLKRGDVVVFKDPVVRNRDLIKRVVGLPGDKIEYADKRLTINGTPLQYTDAGTYDYVENIAPDQVMNFHNQQYIEDLTGVKHKIITFDQVPVLFYQQVINFPSRNDCTYNGNDGFTCVVPRGEYFMMGDNRDNSLDSRYWGFVPDKNILGQAIYILTNFHDLRRSGTKI